MGAVCCKSSEEHLQDDVVIQVALNHKDQACTLSAEEKDGKQLVLLEKPKVIDKAKKAASFASSVTRICKQEMNKAWTDLKTELDTQQLVWSSTHHRKASEKAATESLSQDLQAVLELSVSDIPKAGLELDAVLLKHKAVLSKSISQAGKNIKRLIGLTESREELSKALMARSGKGEKPKVLHTSNEIESIVNVAELTDKRLAGDIKKLLTMIDLDPENRSVGSGSTGLPST
eukprot:TRINITY_DN16433_c0_g1_i1.p1 TRINITY_DN16433_c0_g1~~TRINITY_DN16433_c0_g1_i1.p1  ORF type:complete len:232 (+),score=62.50 TRINITY_DN16433_c0_g1_i1:35-730(+)